MQCSPRDPQQAPEPLLGSTFNICTRAPVEHPFGTIKRMSGGGRFLTRGHRAVKAEAALSILAFNILHAVNAFGTMAIRPS